MNRLKKSLLLGVIAMASFEATYAQNAPAIQNATPPKQFELTPEQKEKREALKVERMEQKEAMEKVLTPEQKEKMGKIKEMRKDLNLTPEQKEKMREIRKANQSDIKEKREAFRNSLTEEQKEALKQKMKEKRNK
jgi:Spy/CpxP family protein refolding chaperone